MGAHAQTCSDFDDAYALPLIDDAAMDESSGLAASRVSPGVFYTHNDGRDARLFAFNALGTRLGTWTLPLTGLNDWEDLAITTCPDGDGDCIVVGDIGADGNPDGRIRVWWVREPIAGASPLVVARHEAAWPAGIRDAEALVAHPCTGEIRIITRDDSGISQVFALPDRDDGQPLVPIATITITGLSNAQRRITGADWSQGGTELTLLVGRTAWRWSTDPTDPDAHWSDQPTQVDLPNVPNVEGIAYLPDGGLIVSGESSPLQVAVLPCAKTASERPCDRHRACGCANAPQGVAPIGFAAWLLLGAGRLRGLRCSRRAARRATPRR